MLWSSSPLHRKRNGDGKFLPTSPGVCHLPQFCQVREMCVCESRLRCARALVTQFSLPAVVSLKCSSFSALKPTSPAKIRWGWGASLYETWCSCRFRWFNFYILKKNIWKTQCTVKTKFENLQKWIHEAQSPLFVTLKDIHAHEGPDLLSQSILTVSGRHKTKSQFISAVCLTVSFAKVFLF